MIAFAHIFLFLVVLFLFFISFYWHMFKIKYSFSQSFFIHSFCRAVLCIGGYRRSSIYLTLSFASSSLTPYSFIPCFTPSMNLLFGPPPVPLSGRFNSILLLVESKKNLCLDSLGLNISDVFSFKDFRWLTYFSKIFQTVKGAVSW